MWTLRPEAQRGGLNHRTRLEANKMVWAGGNGQLWSSDHRGTSGTEWLNFHFHPILGFELTGLFYTEGWWYQAHTCYHTLRCYRGSQGKVGEFLVHGSPITTYYWQSSFTFPSPREGTTALGVSELQTAFSFGATREGFILVWWGSAKVIIVLNLPFVLLVQNYNYQCPAATNSTFFKGVGLIWLCLVVFKFSTHLWVLRSGFLARQDKGKSFWGLFQPTEKHSHTDTKTKTKTTTAKSKPRDNKHLNNETLHFAGHVKSCAPIPCTVRQATVVSSCCSWPRIKAAPVTCQQLRPSLHPQQQVHWA